MSDARQLVDKSWNFCNLESLLDISIGGIWGEENGVSEVDVDVVRVTELKAYGVIEPGTAVKRSITKKQFQSRALEVGDLLLEKSGGGPNTPVGRVGYVLSVNSPMVCSNFMQLMRPDTEQILPIYLHLFLMFLHSNGETIPLQTSTTNIRNIKTPEYMAINVPVPSLSEQAKIVEILEEQLSRLNAALASVRLVRDKAARLRRSLLHAAFTGGLTGHDTATGTLPIGWYMQELGQLGKWTTGCTPSTKYPKYFGGLTPFVTPGDISERGYLNESRRTLSKEGVSVARSVLPPSVLLVCIGATLGKVALANQEVVTNQQINALEVDTKKVSSMFLKLLLSSQLVQEMLWNGSSSTTVPIINKRNLELLRVALPPPAEQEKIVTILEEQLSRLDASLAVADAIEKKSSAMRRSLLHAAFTGELTKEWREGAHV